LDINKWQKRELYSSNRDQDKANSMQELGNRRIYIYSDVLRQSGGIRIRRFYMFREKVQAVPQLNNEEVQWQQREKDFQQDLLADSPVFMQDCECAADC
jgi:hypothetical protein